MCRLTIVGIALVVRYGPKADTKYADGFENFHAVTFDVFDVLNATFCARDFTQRSLALGKHRRRMMELALCTPRLAFVIR